MLAPPFQSRCESVHFARPSRSCEIDGIEALWRAFPRLWGTAARAGGRARKESDTDARLWGITTEEGSLQSIGAVETRLYLSTIGSPP
jgi:hypothetical protein